jgi:hypothetical protein
MIAFNSWEHLYFVAQALLPVHDALKIIGLWSAGALACDDCFQFWEHLYFVAQALLPVHDAFINYLIMERSRPRL